MKGGGISRHKRGQRAAATEGGKAPRACWQEILPVEFEDRWSKTLKAAGWGVGLVWERMRNTKKL